MELLVGIWGIPPLTICFETFTMWDKYKLNAFTFPYNNGYTKGVNNKNKVINEMPMALETLKGSETKSFI
jgi:transposase